MTTSPASEAPALPRVAVSAVRPVDEAAAAAWAERLGLRLWAAAEAAKGGAGPYDALLEVGADGLALRLPDGPRVRVAPRVSAQRRPGGRDLLLRAVGRVTPEGTVVDATAGLGDDAFHLASQGLRVILMERSPLVAALLEDALERARSGHEGDAAARAAARMRLLVGDARELLRSLDPPPDAVVLDPMYPRTGKRSLPGKGMALFRSLVGDDADAPGLLEAALAVAQRRVAVKRPKRAPALGAERGAPRPSGSVVGTTTRYDLYAPRCGST